MDPAAKLCLQQLWPGTDLEIAPVIASGWSGMPIWKVASKREPLSVSLSSGNCCEQENTYSLRSWPRCSESFTKIQYWTEVIDSYRGKIKSCPFPAPIPWAWGQSNHRYVVRGETYFWTLAPWRRGSPLQQHQIDQATRLALVRWLASIHSTTQRIGTRVGISHALQDRWTRFSSLKSQFSLDRFALQLQRKDVVDDRSTNHERARSFQQRLQPLEDRFRTHCEAMIRQPHVQHWIVRDLWRENVLQDSDRCLSIVDLGAARVEWPLFDLVRLLGSLRALKSEWEECIEIYFDERGIKPSYSTPSLRTLHAVSIALSIAYWLDLKSKRLPSPNVYLSPSEPTAPVDNETLTKSQDSRVDQRLEELFWEWDHSE